MKKSNSFFFFACLTLAFVSTGCTAFRTKSVASSGKTTITFDDSFPSALEDVFDTCHDPLTLEAGMNELDPAGSCSSLSDVSGSDAQTLLLLLMANGDIAFDSEIPEDAASASGTYSNLPWPVQNCDIDYEYDVKFDKFKLYDLVSQWKTVSSKPALHIGLDGNSSQKIGQLVLSHTINCPSGINQAILRAAVGALIPEKSYDLTIEDLELDVDVKLSYSGANINATMAVDVEIDKIKTGNAILNAIANTSNNLTEIEDSFAASVKSALTSVPDQVEELIESEIEDGHTICSLAISGTSLVMVTDEVSAGGQADCK